MTSSWALPSPRHRPRITAAGTPSVLPITSSAAPASSSATAITRRVQLVAGRVAHALEVEQRLESRRCRSRRRSCPGARAAERVADDHADLGAGALAQAVADAGGRCVGILGQEHDACPAPARWRRRRPPRRRRSRAGSRRSRAAGGRGRCAPTRAGSPRSAADRVVDGDALRLLRGLDVGEAHDSALGLGDDLLRDDEHVTVLEPARSAISAARSSPSRISGNPSSGMIREPVTAGR